MSDFARLQHLEKVGFGSSHVIRPRFDTEAGAGTTFYLRLPIDDAVESAA